MASMRASETSHVKLHKKWKNKKAMAHAHTRTVSVEGAITASHSEVKLGPCTSVLRIVLQDIIINRLYIVSLYTIFRIAHQGTFILHVFICMGVASGCGEQEAGVVNRSGWNL